jgi:hypothetical protein
MASTSGDFIFLGPGEPQPRLPEIGRMSVVVSQATRFRCARCVGEHPAFRCPLCFPAPKPTLLQRLLGRLRGPDPEPPFLI